MNLDGNAAIASLRLSTRQIPGATIARTRIARAVRRICPRKKSRACLLTKGLCERPCCEGNDLAVF